MSESKKKTPPNQSPPLEKKKKNKISSLFKWKRKPKRETSIMSNSKARGMEISISSKPFISSTPRQEQGKVVSLIFGQPQKSALRDPKKPRSVVKKTVRFFGISSDEENLSHTNSTDSNERYDFIENSVRIQERKQKLIDAHPKKYRKRNGSPSVIRSRKPVRASSTNNLSNDSAEAKATLQRRHQVSSHIKRHGKEREEDNAEAPDLYINTDESSESGTISETDAITVGRNRSNTFDNVVSPPSSRLYRMTAQASNENAAPARRIYRKKSYQSSAPKLSMKTRRNSIQIEYG